MSRCKILTMTRIRHIIFVFKKIYVFFCSTSHRFQVEFKKAVVVVAVDGATDVEWLVRESYIKITII